LNAQQKSNTRGSDHYDAGALVFINRAKNLTLENNLVQRSETAGTSLVKTTKNATEIKGLEDGVKVAPARTAQVTSPFDFQYTASNGEQQREVRDPAIIREGDTYYMTFTMWPFANREDNRMNLPDNGSSPGIRIFSSKDLKTWTPGNWLVKSSDLPENSPYKNRFWAPEIHKFNNKFYLVFTGDNWIKGEYNQEGKWGAAGYAFVGVADKVDGPYRHLTYIPGGACDTTLAQAKDGTIYAIMPKYNIFSRPIDLSKLEQGIVKWLGPEKKIIECASGDTVLGTDPNYLEGPWMEKVGSEYVLFYAETFKHGYWAGAAYSDSPAGPFRKDPRGLIFWGGHTSIFDGPDGRKWVSYRIEDSEQGRGTPSAKPLDFDGNGRVQVEALPSSK
jgi:xylan 1,4-beta-xylosidase